MDALKALPQFYRRWLRSRARVLLGLLMGLPLIYSETLCAMKEADSLRAAWDGGEGVVSYAQRRCEAAGVPVSSDAYFALLGWASVMVAAWQPDEERVSTLAELAEPEPSVEEWDDMIPG
jgi:hypothetical protein